MAKFAILPFLLFSVVGALANPVQNAKPLAKESDPGHRLDGSINAISYILSIRPYFDTGDDREFTFDGEVTISLTPSRDNVQQIVLHAQNLTINSSDITITSYDGIVALNQSTPIETDEQYSFFKINLESPLSANLTYDVRIKYTGPIRSDMAGFYRSSYVADNETRWLGTTQMEPTSARKVFPCFDEPNYKATITLTITAPSQFTAVLSNTKKETSTSLSDNLISTKFLTTPKMSTYLLAFLISDFEAASLEEGAKEVGIWSRPEVKGLTGFAFDTAKSVVKALSEYLGIEYYEMDVNLNFDHIAVPDFNAGAMENWGLITYREAYLIYDEQESNLRYRQQITTIIAHETAHMWFGNLVTCHWWSNTWLNEGFANYFQYFIGKVVQPTMGLEEQFVLTSVQGALAADQSEESAPLTNENVNSPSEISGHFGTITYSKGGSIIRMIENLIGASTLQKGLGWYLRNNSYNSGYPESLFTDLDLASIEDNSLQDFNINVAKIYSNWTVQAGFPLITVKADFNNGNITVSQERFFISSETPKSDQIYLVPISYTTQKEGNRTIKPKFILADKETTFNKGSNDHEWIILNVNQSGYYRVNYDEHLWEMIILTLKSDNFQDIPVLSRAQLIDDVFALARADILNYEDVLKVTDYLERERSYFVWVSAISGFNFLRSRLEIQPETLANLNKYILKLLSGIISDLGFEEQQGDDFLTKRNRMQILEIACSLGHEQCQEYSAGLFKNLKSEQKPIPVNQRPMAYCAGLRDGDNSDYELLWKKYVDSLMETEKLVILSSLGCSSNEDSIKAFLNEITKNESLIRKQDASTAYSSALQSKSNAKYVFDFIKANLEQVRLNYDLSSALGSLTSSFKSEEELKAIEDWKTSESRLTADERKTVENAVTSSRKYFEWTNKHANQLTDPLKLRNSASSLEISLTLTVATLLFTTYFL